MPGLGKWSPIQPIMQDPRSRKSQERHSGSHLTPHNIEVDLLRPAYVPTLMARAPCTVAVCCALLALVEPSLARRPVHEYEIDLDLAPEHRWGKVIQGASADGTKFNDTVWGFYNTYFAKDPVLTDALYLLADTRGKEVEELQGEVEGLAAMSGLPLKFVQGIQMLYELQTLMVPVVNTSGYKQLPIPKEWEALARIPWRGPGCTGIIAQTADGTVAHARNLDFSPVPFMTKLVFTGIFTKGGKEVFRSQMVAGYASMVTGMKMGPNGFAIERNTRYPDHASGNEEMFKNLVGGRPLNGWSLRKILEEQPDYDAAIKAIATVPYISTEYAIVSGVQKGVILAKDPDTVAHTQTLGRPNWGQRDDYIIITNFDFYWDDIRENFDPTGGCLPLGGAPHGCYNRRVTAQRMLNATAQGSITPEYLFETINHEHTLADTIFQAIIDVEKGLWNVSQPDKVAP